MIHAFLAAATLCASASAQEPKDFDAFWAQTRTELSAEPLEPALEADAAHTGADAACFKARYRSLHGSLVHAWYCRPTHKGKFPGVLISPWFGEGAIDAPAALAKRGLAVLWYQGRGYEVDQASYPDANQSYVLDGIDDPRTYVYREIVSHALRGLDFLAARPEVDAGRLAAMGASQGGGLSLLVAGLDPRVTLAAADFPFLTDWPRSMKDAEPPYAQVRDYLEKNPGKREAALATLSYFDTLDVAGRIRAPVFVQVGLADRTCPAAPIAAMFEKIGSGDKSLLKYPDAGHGDRNAQRWAAMERFIVDRLTAR